MSQNEHTTPAPDGAEAPVVRRKPLNAKKKRNVHKVKAEKGEKAAKADVPAVATPELLLETPAPTTTPTVPPSAPSTPDVSTPSTASTAVPPTTPATPATTSTAVEPEERTSNDANLAVSSRTLQPHATVIADDEPIRHKSLSGDKKKKKAKKAKKSKKDDDDEGEDPMVTKRLVIVRDGEEAVFNIANSIGRGAYGEVFQGMNANTGQFVAIKQMHVTKRSVMNEVMEEIALLQKLQHPRIVTYIANTKSHGYLYIVMEYMESGSLLNIIHKFHHLSEHLTAKYIHQVLEGLVYLHEQGIIHRDIKAANILVSKDGTVKIADFGVSIQMDNPNRLD